jgi:hypothetical protein
VIDVAHDRDDRGPVDKHRALILVLTLGCLLGLFIGRVDDPHRQGEILGNQFDGLIAHRLIDGHHLAESQQDLHDLVGRPIDLRGEILDRDAAVDADLVGGRCLRRGGRCFHRGGRLLG